MAEGRTEVVRDVDGVDDAEIMEATYPESWGPELVHAPETIGSGSHRLELCRVLGGVAAVIEDAVHALGGVAAEGDRVLGPLRVGGVRSSGRACQRRVSAVHNEALKARHSRVGLKWLRFFSLPYWIQESSVRVSGPPRLGSLPWKHSSVRS